MPLEADFISYITGIGAVSSKIGTRLYLHKLPQGVTLPAVVYQRISRSSPQTHDQKASGLLFERFQFTVYARTGEDTSAVEGAFFNALEGFKGSMGSTVVGSVLHAGTTDGYDPDHELEYTTMDYMIGYQK